MLQAMSGSMFGKDMRTTAIQWLETTKIEAEQSEKSAPIYKPQLNQPARSASWCCVAPTHRVVFACRPHVDSHVDKRSRWTSGWIISWENNGRIVGNQGMISWDELSAIWVYCWAQWHGWPLGLHQMVLYPNGWPFFYVLGIWWLYKLWIWIDSGYTHV